MAERAAPAAAGALRRLVAALAEDLRLALLHGAARDPRPAAAGETWLTHAAIAALVLGAGLFWLVGYQAGFARLNGAAAGLPESLWQALTVLGDERTAFALSLFFSRRHPRVFWTLVCAALVGILYSRGLKPLVDAARPPAVLAEGSFHLIGPSHRGQGFPSGHSVTAGVFYGVLVLYARRLPWRALFLSTAVLAGLSRTAVGVHWPVDVAFGLGGGLLAAWVGARLAARSPWGVYDGRVHLAFVTLAAIVTVGLWFDDGGYVATAPGLKLLCLAALGTVALGYGLLPLWRVLRGTAPTA
jgi:membrane-associated phospholipid phosphatase